MSWKMIKTPYFLTDAQEYSEFYDICEGCEWLNDGCDGDFDQRESCEHNLNITTGMMQEEDAEYKKRQELLLAKKQEEESAKFYTENPDFLEV